MARTDNRVGIVGESSRIRTGEAIGLLREEYPGVGGIIDGLGDCFAERVQYEAVLSRGAGGDTEKVVVVARYGAVEFRRPYSEAYIETRSADKARREIRRLAGEGYAVVRQTATLGMVSGEVCLPSR